MRVLVTNDDGIESPGIHALAGALERAGHDVLVVSPREDMSGVGAAIGRVRADQHIDTLPATIPDAAGVRAYSFAGPPGLAVMAGCLEAFGPAPDVVVSGINAGPNLGHACLHSGTVGAALTASTFGVSALAVSSDVSDPMRWQTACDTIDEPLRLLADLPDGTVLNLNVPAVPRGQVRDLRWATLDRFGRVRLALAASSDEWLQMEYRDTTTELDPDCDTALLEQGYATLTALQGLSAIPPERLTEQGEPAIGRPQGVVTDVPD
jgi:5'-nucleotidase